MAKHFESILRKLDRFRDDDDRFCVEIVVNEVKFKAHRDVLRASSDFFEDLFKSCDINQKTVELYSLDPSVFKTVLDFLYSGDLDVKTNDVRDLLMAGKTLKIPEIVEKCSSALQGQINDTNVIDTLNFAIANQVDSLKERTLAFIGSKFSSICVQRELLDVSEDTFVKILSTRLCIEDESQLFETVLRWLNHNIEHRGKYSLKVLCCVRLTNVPIPIIDKSIEHCADSSLKEVLSSLKNCLTIERVSSQKNLSLTIEQTKKKYVYAFYANGREKTISSWDKSSLQLGLMKYDMELNRWQQKNVNLKSPSSDCWYKIALLLGTGSVLNLQDMQWNEKQLMNCPLSSFGYCEFGGKLWAFGGTTHEPFECSIYCYDPLTDLWSQIGINTIYNLRRMLVVSFEGLIYLVGGITYSYKISTKLFSYNPATNQWKELNPFQEKHANFGTAILGRYLYIVGGSNKSVYYNNVERYSFDQNIWEPVPSMTEKRADPAVNAANGLLYVFGGLYSPNCPPSNSAECFDPATNEWKRLASSPIGFVNGASSIK